ncbi:hypothetical protein [Micromonospora sp. NPDC048898]|uniref:hypothetical protein n=1 Tax=Micromonospora sp. NPDC048898 TaxID=3364260 RepID=UPI0037194A23
MTDPYQAQQPQPPYPQGGPVYPPQQPQPQPIGQPEPGAGPPDPLPSPPPANSRAKPLLIAGLAFVAVLMVAASGYAVYDGFIKEDSGVAACKAMAAGKNPDGTTTNPGDDKLTEAEYRKTRELFEDSRHEDIRKHGTALIDIAWQMTQLPEGQKERALGFIAPLGAAVAGFQSACADQGVTVNLNDN